MVVDQITFSQSFDISKMRKHYLYVYIKLLLLLLSPCLHSLSRYNDVLGCNSCHVILITIIHVTIVPDKENHYCTTEWRYRRSYIILQVFIHKSLRACRTRIILIHCCLSPFVCVRPDTATDVNKTISIIANEVPMWTVVSVACSHGSCDDEHSTTWLFFCLGNIKKKYWQTSGSSGNLIDIARWRML